MTLLLASVVVAGVVTCAGCICCCVLMLVRMLSLQNLLQHQLAVNDTLKVEKLQQRVHELEALVPDDSR